MRNQATPIEISTFASLLTGCSYAPAKLLSYRILKPQDSAAQAAAASKTAILTDNNNNNIGPRVDDKSKEVCAHTAIEEQHKHLASSMSNLPRANSIASSVGSVGPIGAQSVAPANSPTQPRAAPRAKFDARAAFQLTRQSRYLCAIIAFLLLIILALLLFGRTNSHSPATDGNAQPVAGIIAGKLITASSDDSARFTMPGRRNRPSYHRHKTTEEIASDNDTDGDDADPDDTDDVEVDNVKSRTGERQRARERSRTHAPIRDGVANDQSPICMSPGCVRAAAQILNNMDNRTAPCDDFYQFACGRWIETQIIPDEKSALSVFSQNTADLNVKLRALIERKPSANDPPIVGQMRNLYTSCMNLSDIEARGDTPLLDVLRDFGGWPVLRADVSSAESSSVEPVSPSVLSQMTSPRSTRFSWLDTIIKFRQRGYSHDMIIDLSVVPDVRNSRRYIIELDQSSLGLPDRSYYFKGMNDTTVAAYFSLMVESAVMLGADRSEARRQMMEALEFETSLARISVPREQRRNVTRMYNKMLAQDLFRLAPNIQWERYLRALLRDDRLDMERDEVVVKVPAFLRALDALLTSTEPRIVANYMIWRVVRHSMSSLSRKWRELAHTYTTVATGRQVEEPRWEQCLGSLEGTLGTALSAFYVKNHFNRQSKAAALEMVDYIRREFMRILEQVDWMDEETRREALDKAHAISPYIGYPDELLQDELVEEQYAGLTMARTNFYQNVRNLRIWSTNYAFNQLRKPNKRGDWKKHARAAVVNAYYNSLENSIEFPAGILQGAFFDAERPSYMNFGAIGYVIGHEITHGFDDRGRQFDKDGNDRNWWKPKTDARYRERAQCIIEQYSNYTVPENGLRVNGMNTQGENIADNGGIKEAFRAYTRWTKDHGKEPRLPGLNYTPDQLFWISAANIWCGKFRPEVLKLRVNSGVHSPAKFRIIGPLSNAPEFSASFNCPLGSPMNPRKKCSVW